MKSFRLFALLAGAVAVISCGNKNNKDNQSLSIVFSPTCGSPGDHVQIEVNTDQCATNGTTVFFAPHDDGIDSTAAAKATVSGGAGDYTLDVVVPADAETGTLLIHGCGNLGGFTVESSSVFTIPCPGNEDPDGGITDGGDDTDASDGGDDADSGTEKAPLAGIVTLHNNPGFAMFNGVFWPGLTDAMAAIRHHLGSLMPDLPEGTCGEVSGETPEVPPPVPVGNVSLKKEGTTVATFEPQTSDTGTFYGDMVDPVTPGTRLDLSIEGANGFPAAELSEFVDVVSALQITSPDISSDLTVPHDDLQLTFGASDATHRSLSVTNILTAKTVQCVINPTASSFTIPKDLFEPGRNYVVTVRQGKLRDVTFDGRNFVSVTSTQETFGVLVEAGN